MIFAVATAINDWWERRVAGNPKGFQPLGALSPFDAQPPRGSRPSPPPIAPVGVPGDTLASLDNLLGLPHSERGHWKAAQSAGLRPELEDVRASAVGELRALDDEIADLRARLAAAIARAEAAEARAQAAEARACSGACAQGGAQ